MKSLKSPNSVEPEDQLKVELVAKLGEFKAEIVEKLGVLNEKLDWVISWAKKETEETNNNTKIVVSAIDETKRAAWERMKVDGVWKIFGGRKLKVGDTIHSVCYQNDEYQKFKTADGVAKFIDDLEKTALRFIIIDCDGTKKKVYLQKPRHDSHLPFEFEDEEDASDASSDASSSDTASDAGMDSGSD